MKMSAGDYRLQSVRSPDKEGQPYTAKVVAGYGTNGYEWPSEVYCPKYEKTFTFVRNEVMDEFTAKHYGGSALYVEKRE